MNTNRFIFEKITPQTKHPLKRNAGIFRRSLASSLDSIILLLIRGFLLQIYGKLFFIDSLTKFVQDFRQEFGTETPKMVESHTSFIAKHPICIEILLIILAMILIGAVYHGYFVSSQWKATIGKRIFEIKAIRKDGKKISFMRGFFYYLFSLIPFLYILHIATQSGVHSTSIYATIVDSRLNFSLGIIFAIWMQFSFLTKSRSTISDFIFRISVVEGKTNAKFPWK